MKKRKNILLALGIVLTMSMAVPSAAAVNRESGGNPGCNPGCTGSSGTGSADRCIGTGRKTTVETGFGE